MLPLGLLQPKSHKVAAFVAANCLAQVVHLCYHTAYPHAPFNPYHVLMPLADGSTTDCCCSSSTSVGSKLAIALYSGDAVRVVHATAQRQPSQPLPQLSPGAAGDGEEDSSTSNFPSPDAEQGAGSPVAAAAAAHDGDGWPAPAGQRAPAQPPAAAPQAGSMQPQQQQGTPASSGRNVGSPPLGSPWPRRRQQQQPTPGRAALPEGSDSELDVQCALVSCTHAVSRGWHPPAPGAGNTASRTNDGSLAAVSIGMASAHLDLEACVYAALQQQGLPASDLLDYAAAPVQACSWQGRDGLLLLAVLRLRRPQPAATAQQEVQLQQPQQHQQQQQVPSRSACVLLHVAADSGCSEVVEWLEPPYPWHADLAAYMVQQTALAGGLAVVGVTYGRRSLAECWVQVMPVLQPMMAAALAIYHAALQGWPLKRRPPSLPSSCAPAGRPLPPAPACRWCCPTDPCWARGAAWRTLHTRGCRRPFWGTAAAAAARAGWQMQEPVQRHCGCCVTSLCCTLQYLNNTRRNGVLGSSRSLPAGRRRSPTEKMTSAAAHHAGQKCSATRALQTPHTFQTSISLPRCSPPLLLAPRPWPLAPWLCAPAGARWPSAPVSRACGRCWPPDLWCWQRVSSSPLVPLPLVPPTPPLAALSPIAPFF